MKPNTLPQLICAWCGPVFVVVFFLGMLLAGVIPPPSPDLSSSELADDLISDTDTFRVGIMLTLVSTALYGFFSAGVSVQLKRVEGEHSPMTYVQLGLGMLAVLLVIFPMMFLMTAAYRPERSDELIRLLSDMAWLPFVGTWMTVVFQWLATAIAIFSDDSEDPIFPRWAGYVNLWVAAQSLPSSVLFFVHDGPFAWNGVLSYWLAATAFAGWILVMTVLLIRAIRKQAVATA